MNTKQKKIFVVEDNRMYASMIENHLTQYPDCEVKLFYNGEDCMLAFEENPDVVLLDFHLNVDDETAKTGFDYLKIIKERNPEQAVVMLSSMNRCSQCLLCFICHASACSRPPEPRRRIFMYKIN